MEFEDIRNIMTVMVLAAIQADGKEIYELSTKEFAVYADKSAADLKLALEVVEGEQV